MAAKIVSDSLKNGKQILLEGYNLVTSLTGAYPWLLPYKEQNGKYSSLPKYIVASKAALEKTNLINFKVNYPALCALTDDGKSDAEGSKRLLDGLYHLGVLKHILEDNKFILKTDDIRNKAKETTATAIGDLVIYLIIQFRLNNCYTEVQMAVNEVCETFDVTPSVFYGNFLQILDEFNQHPYGYEVLSPYYNDIMDMDSTFAADCEDCCFPLTDDMCADLISGKLSLTKAKAKVDAFKASTVVVGMDNKAQQEFKPYEENTNSKSIVEMIGLE